MKSSILFCFILIASSHYLFAQQDAEGCADSPMFPNRMPNYFISECTSNFDEMDFNLNSDGTKMQHKEGTKIMVRYDFNAESGQQKPSVLQILKNYENAAKKIGGVTLFQNAAAAMGTYKLMKNGQETAWVKLECGGNDSNDFYVVTILQLEQMKQDVTAVDILTALNTDGHIALYINFDTGKSEIKPESQEIIDQIAEMLKANPTLKISIEGHTDNVGAAAANQLLSENRAKSLMNALIQKGNNKSLLSAKGWGSSKPISDNSTEEGRFQNRIVEIIKL
jgi:OOP family OmpA-OmpF porin